MLRVTEPMTINTVWATSENMSAVSPPNAVNKGEVANNMRIDT